MSELCSPLPVPSLQLKPGRNHDKEFKDSKLLVMPSGSHSAVPAGQDMCTVKEQESSESNLPAWTAELTRKGQSRRPQGKQALFIPESCF